mmetsp:Transcript_33255/g.43839  ORF Transcript_33255/g.43839 Transcript_33255/m.43839 type:complete len:287 (+) Transcript_33255:103-963(+)
MVCDNTYSDSPGVVLDESGNMKRRPSDSSYLTKKIDNRKEDLNPLTSIFELFDVDRETAQKHAIYSAYVSIIAGLGELYLSVAAGEDDDSNSVFGVASMAFIETTGSILVVWRWQCASHSLTSSQLDKIEARSSLAIGFGMLFTVAMLLTSSFDSLILHETPDGEKESFIVSCYTAAASLFLFLYKYYVGTKLKSMVVLSDARSSLCAGLVAFAVILSEYLQRWMWSADDVMGIVLSFYILYQAFFVIGEAWNELNSQDGEEKVKGDNEKDPLLGANKGAPFESNI